MVWLRGILFGGGGALLIMITALDLFWTTLAVSGGGGPITARLSRSLWNAALWMHHRRGWHDALRAAGVAMFLLIVLLWALALWLGWTLIFLADPQSIIEAQTGTPADFWGRVYFAGYTVFSLGVGDYRPQGALWQVLTPIATASGLGMLTLAVTYLVPIVQAVVDKRRLARLIRLMGDSPWQMARYLCQQRDRQTLDTQLSSLCAPILLLSERHHAYPVLHYFHAMKHAQAAGAAVVTLDEALTLLKHGLREPIGPSPAAIDPLRQAIGVYFRTLRESYVDPPHHAPPAPSLKPLDDAGLPVVDQQTFENALRRLDDRRRMSLALVRHEGWDWDAVYEHEP